MDYDEEESAPAEEADNVEVKKEIKKEDVFLKKEN